MKDYLRLAGGANREADKNRAYVIRADGSVISKQQISSLRRDGFDSLREQLIDIPMIEAA